MNDLTKVEKIKGLKYDYTGPVYFLEWNHTGFTRTKSNRLAGEFRNIKTGSKRIVGIDDATGVPLVLWG